MNQINNSKKIYHAAIYVRLSKEDEMCIRDRIYTKHTEIDKTINQTERRWWS